MKESKLRQGIFGIGVGIVVFHAGCHVHLFENAWTNRPPGVGLPLVADAPPFAAPPSGIDWPMIGGGFLALILTAWAQHRATTGKVKNIVDTRRPSSSTGAK